MCGDLEWIIKGNIAIPCKCREAKQYQRILDTSGISEAFQKRTLNDFKAYNEQTKKAKSMAIAYCKDFESIKSSENNSIAFLGQAGSGKTHLSMGIANHLMKQMIGVRYMQYREALPKIKQAANDDINYTKEINKYKDAPVLLIDDLYKKAVSANRSGDECVNDADLRVMFEIINHRYLIKAPMIISSEYTTEQLISFDEAIGSRIIQLSKGRISEMHGKELNYRLGG